MLAGTFDMSGYSLVFDEGFGQIAIFRWGRQTVETWKMSANFQYYIPTFRTWWAFFYLIVHEPPSRLSRVSRLSPLSRRHRGIFRLLSKLLAERG